MIPLSSLPQILNINFSLQSLGEMEVSKYFFGGTQSSLQRSRPTLMFHILMPSNFKSVYKISQANTKVILLWSNQSENHIYFGWISLRLKLFRKFSWIWMFEWRAPFRQTFKTFKNFGHGTMRMPIYSKLETVFL